MSALTPETILSLISKSGLGEIADKLIAKSNNICKLKLQLIAVIAEHTDDSGKCEAKKLIEVLVGESKSIDFDEEEHF